MRLLFLAASAAGAALHGDPTNYTFGSTPLGLWQPDALGLPSFAVNLSVLAAAAPSIYSDVHLVGNDRVFAFVAADGGSSARQDEGGPKMLNDFAPPLHQFAGGVGWLFAGGGSPAPLCDTNVTPSPARYAQTMALGVARLTKTCAAPGGLAVEHTLWAPFGDAPVLVSTVTITNGGSAPAAGVQWLEQWAAGAPVLLAGGLVRPAAWGGTFEALPGGAGVLSRKVNSAGNPAAPVLEDDPAPRPAFFVSLDAAAGGGGAPSFCVDGGALFGAGGPRAPALGALRNSTAPPRGGWREGVLALASPPARLAPGASLTISNAYGYLPSDGDTVEGVVGALLRAFGPPGLGALGASTAAWRDSLAVVLDVPSAGAWVARETAWHSYTLRALLSFDTYRQRFNLNQNGEYQQAYLRPSGRAPEIGGFNGASRDSVAHVIPFIYAAPAGARAFKDTLKFWLQTQLDSGMLAWAQAGYGVDWRGWDGAPFPWRGHVCSDLPYWPLLAAAEYVLATRDAAFLQEPVARNATGGGALPPQSVLALLLRGLHALLDGASGDGVGLGAHGLLRVLACDHNDGWASAINIPYYSPLYAVVNATGESVMSSATAAFALCRFADALAFAGAADGEAAARAACAQLRAAVVAASAGAAFVPRAWLGDGPGLGWFGADAPAPDAGGLVRAMWMEPQAWAVLAGALNGSAAEAVLARVQARLCDTSPIGCQNVDGCYGGPVRCVYAGVDHFSNWPLIWALGATGRADAALRAFVKNSMAVRAAVYPNYTYGVTSGTDGWAGALFTPAGEAPGASKYPTYLQFNSWEHSEPLHSAVNAMGVVFTPLGVTLAGGLLSAPAYALATAVVGFERSGPRNFSGHYLPHVAGNWSVEVLLDAGVAAAFSRVQVNGACQPLARASEGRVARLSWWGEGGGAAPLAWALGPCA